jgi:hypothetical protein
MKYILKFLFWGILLSLSSGFYINIGGDNLLGNKVIGFTVLAATFVFMPLFLVYRWKGKRLEDYTLSKKNLEKLRDLDQKK